MKYEDAKNLLEQGELARPHFFHLLKYIATAKMEPKTLSAARDIALRCMDKIGSIENDLREALTDVLADLGYYPYMKSLPGAERKALQLEFHRSEVLDEVVMHSEQLRIASLLLSGTSVVLSAPTSFGKSLLIEEIVGATKFDNIVIVQPTLALVDETRSKLAKYSDYYKIIFSTNQKVGPRNLFILTAERVVEFSNLPGIDFFVIDEFYKLSSDRDDERAVVLNHAFYLLLRRTKHFYLLGPTIGSIPSSFPIEFTCMFIRSVFATVASNHYHIHTTTAKDKSTKLNQLLTQCTDPTLIYCQAPAAAEKTALHFIAQSGINLPWHQEHDDVIAWVKENLHPDWSLIKCLQRGVGFHHGRLPRYLARYLVHAFNEGTIKYLFCTSTLIEGVNTSAKNVVIYDGKMGRDKPIDFFDFANIAGRSGRMGRHFIGNVYIFPEVPEPVDIDVDFPWYTQTNATDALLVQLDDDDLKPSSRTRLEPYLKHPLVSLDLLRKNSNVPPDGQIRLAEYLDQHHATAHAMLSWSLFPTTEQLYYTCQLMWEYFKPRGEAGVYSGKQLAFVINRYRALKSPNAIIREILRTQRKYTVDMALSECMNQIRVWSEFRFPKLLLALDGIQKAVFQKHGRVPGNFAYFAGEVENGFIHRNLAALKEFGVPPQVAAKIQHLLGDLDDFDGVIERIRLLEQDRTSLTRFERRLLSEL